MSRVPWKSGKIISIAVRRNEYVLAQMLKPPYLMFFNLFRRDEHWSKVELGNSKKLFCVPVTRQFISASTVTKQDIKPAIFNDLPRYWIQATSGGHKVTVWKGSLRERNIMIMGEGGALVEYDINTGWNMDKIIIPTIALDDNVTIDKYELTNIRIFPELNERLHLCHILDRNIDPLKDLIFRRPLPAEYETYIDLIGPRAKTLVKELY